MARQFDVPVYYRSPIISKVKDARRVTDPRKKDLSPTVMDFGPMRVKIARHFGFCYGVENAIEIAYRALEENEGKRLRSEERRVGKEVRSRSARAGQTY